MPAIGDGVSEHTHMCEHQLCDYLLSEGRALIGTSR